jgi:hypothetical protein
VGENDHIRWFVETGNARSPGDDDADIAITDVRRRLLDPTCHLGPGRQDDAQCGGASFQTAQVLFEGERATAVAGKHLEATVPTKHR